MFQLTHTLSLYVYIYGYLEVYMKWCLGDNWTVMGEYPELDHEFTNSEYPTSRFREKHQNQNELININF